MQLLNKLKNGFAYLLIIFLVALTIRLVGIDYGLPYDNFHSDEPKMVLSSTHVAVKFVNSKSILDFEQQQYKYPHGAMNVFSGVFVGIYFITRIVDKVFRLDQMIFSTFDNSTFTLFARITVAVVGSLLSVLIYLIGRELKLGKFVSLGWALMLAVNLGLGVHSKYATRNIISVFLAYLGLYYLFKYINRKTLQYLIIGSFFIGFAVVSSLERAFFIIPIVIAVYFVSEKNVWKFIKAGIISGAIFCIGMFLSSPYIFINYDRFMENGLGGQQETQSFGQIGRTALTPLYVFFNQNNVDFDQKVPNAISGNLILFVFIISIFGVLYKLIKKADRFDAILLSVLIIQLIIFSKYRSQMIRWYVALLPIFLYYFVYLTLNMKNKLKNLFVGLFIIGFLLNLFYSLEFSYSKTLPDTRVIAKDWINSNLEKDSFLYTTYWSSNGDFKGAGIPFYYYEQKHDMQNTLAPDFNSYFCRENLTKNEYVVVSSYVTNIYNYNETKIYYPKHSKSFINFYDLIDKNFKLVKVVKGDKLFENPGPTLKIYKVIYSNLNCVKKI